MTSPTWTLIQLLVPKKHRQRCPWCHLKSNSGVRCNSKYTHFNLFGLDWKRMHRWQTLDTWQYMYVTGNGKMCTNRYIFCILTWAAQFVNATIPEPVSGVWCHATKTHYCQKRPVVPWTQVSCIQTMFNEDAICFSQVDISNVHILWNYNYNHANIVNTFLKNEVPTLTGGRTLDAATAVLVLGQKCEKISENLLVMKRSGIISLKEHMQLVRIWSLWNKLGLWVSRLVAILVLHSRDAHAQFIMSEVAQVITYYGVAFLESTWQGCYHL